MKNTKDKEVLLIYENRPYRAITCLECGKIKKVYQNPTKKTFLGYVLLTDDEIYKNNISLPKIEVEDIYKKSSFCRC